MHAQRTETKLEREREREAEKDAMGPLALREHTSRSFVSGLIRTRKESMHSSARREEEKEERK